MESLMQAIKEFGPQIGLICFFIWRDFNREKSMGARLLRLEEYQRGELENMIRTTQKVIQDNMYYFKALMAKNGEIVNVRAT